MERAISRSFIDMVGREWFENIGEIVARHPQVFKIICGHGHVDVSGMLGKVPVQMAGAIAHQLIAGRAIPYLEGTIEI